MPLESHVYSYTYVFVFFLMAFFALRISLTGDKKALTVNYEWQKISLFLVVLLFIGCRSFVSFDFSGYYPYFNYLPRVQDGTDALYSFLHKNTFARWEKGFIYYTVLLKSIYANYFFYTFISSLLFLWVTFCLFSVFCKNYATLAVLFFFVFGGPNITFNLQRNELSIALFFISLIYLRRGNIKKYVLLNVFGCFFHISSIFYIPLFLFIRRKYSFRFFLIVFILGNVIFLGRLRLLGSLIVIAGKFVPGRLGRIMISYALSEHFGRAIGLSIGFIERSLTYVLALMSYRKVYTNKDGILAFNFLIFYLCCYLFLAEMEILVSRIGILFVFSYWLFYPRLYAVLKKDWKILFLLLFFVYAFLKLYASYNNAPSRYENFLLPHNSFETRLHIYNAYRASKGLGAKIF